MAIRQQILIWSAVAISFIALLGLLSDILLPFVAGLAIGYFLDPLVDKLEARKLSRGLATGIVISLFFVLLVALSFMLLPVMQSQVVGFSERLPGYIAKLREGLWPHIIALASTMGIDVATDAQAALGEIGRDVFSVLGKVLGQLWSSGLAIFNLISLVVIAPIVAFYMVRDWDLIVTRIDSWLPRQHAGLLRMVAADIDEVLANFVRGQGTVCLILAAFYASTLSIAGLEFGLIIGIFSGLISFIPFLGAMFGLVLSMLTAVTQFWPDYFHIGMVALIFAVGQILEGNILTPRMLGEKVGLHPVWVIFALLAGGALMGFVGILIAIPTAAVIGVIVRVCIKNYLQSRLYLGPEGSPPENSDAGDTEAVLATNSDTKDDE